MSTTSTATVLTVGALTRAGPAVKSVASKVVAGVGSPRSVTAGVAPVATGVPHHSCATKATHPDLFIDLELSASLDDCLPCTSSLTNGAVSSGSGTPLGFSRVRRSEAVLCRVIGCGAELCFVC